MTARELHAFAVTIPAGTAQAAPQTTALQLPQAQVELIEVLIPAGCNGVVGFRLASAGQQIVPVNTGAWVIDTGRTLSWSFARWITSGAWQLVGYNTGRYDHTLQVRFHIADLPTDRTPRPVDTSAIDGMTSYDPAGIPALIAATDAAAGLEV